MKNHDVHYCPFCDKDRLLTDWGTCSKCGRDFVEGMDEDKLLETLKGYRELVKMMAGAVNEGEVPAIYQMRIAAIRKHSKCRFDMLSSSLALTQMAEMLTEECEDEK